MPREREDHLKKIAKEIRLMRQSKEEDKFLSKLDMMFSVLASLTIFVSGIVINNSLNPVNPYLIGFGISILIVFVVALIGEFVAILRDDLTQRLDFWMVLVFGIVQVTWRAVVVSLFAFYGPFTGSFFNFFGMIFIAFFVALGMKHLQKRYMGKFPRRKKEIEARRYLDLVILSAVIGAIIRLPDFLIATLYF